MAVRTLIDRAMFVGAHWHARQTLVRFMRAIRHATTLQEHLLLEKLHRNAGSDFGRRYGFRQVRSYTDFQRQVPLQTYEQLEPEINRLREGDFSALLGEGQQVLMFALTSGTCGQPKFIPVTRRFLNEFRSGWNAFGLKALADHPGTFLRPIVQVTSRMDEQLTRAGIPCGAITGLLAATQKSLVRKYYVTPRAAAYINDAPARYYTIMRLAVAVPDVAFLITANPATQLRLARTADQQAESLIRDIRDGTLRRDLDIPEAVRGQLQPRLLADPIRARQLEQLLRRHGRLLPRHYWSLGFLCNWTGGTMGLYLRDFPEYFGEAPVRDIGLLASEGRMSIPLQDGTAAGVLDVTSHFYEFISAEQVNQPQPECLRSHELQVGSDYFVVLTNSAGLYRYQIGDRVRVTGYEQQAPIIEFLDKGAHISSMSGEKLTENQVVMALNPLISALGATNYLLAPQFEETPHYLLHLEPSPAAPLQTEHLAQLAQQADDALCRQNIEYAGKRSSLRLGPLRLNLLPPGFLEQRDQQLSRRYRANNEQYKHQFLLTKPGDDADFPLNLQH
ncbi:MAG: hypothetical protein HJJLKODD_01185 [Phycisphaerae bacterium]|nr:hypothetical protein [Phycisphaerae bacterium]